VRAAQTHGTYKNNKLLRSARDMEGDSRSSWVEKGFLWSVYYAHNKRGGRSGDIN